MSANETLGKRHYSNGAILRFQKDEHAFMSYTERSFKAPRVISQKVNNGNSML